MTLNYKQLLVSEQKTTNKSVVMTFGRMNPVTKGHSLLVNAVVSTAQKTSADHVIFVSKTQDSKKNPLNVNQKLAYLRAAYKNVNFIAATEATPSLIHIIKSLSGKYNNLYVVAGSDRLTEYKALLDKYNGKEYNFNKIVVVSSGDRDPDVDGAAGMSASKMREFSKNNNFTKFKQGAPDSLSLSMVKKMFDDVRNGMNINEQSNMTREQYLKEEIFNVGDVVVYQNEEATIEVRGSNYVILHKEDGDSARVWLSEITATNKVNNEIKMLHENKLKIARIIGMSLGYTDAEQNNDPTDIINTALRSAKGKALNTDAKRILQRMIDTAKSANIKFNDALAKQVMNEDETKTYKQLRDYLCDDVKEKEDDDNDLTDAELEKIIKDLDDEELLSMCYDDEEMVVVDDEDEVVEEDYQFDELNEVLSRVERMKSRIHMARSRAKRGKKLKMALKRKSSTPVLVSRARRAAVRLLKKRLARKSASQMSVGEKERVERRLKNMKGTINRIATKLLPKVRQIEKTRLSNLANKKR